MLAREKSLMVAEKPGYPLYAAQVPGGSLYVERWPVNKFILRFDYIYDMFHMTKLDFQFIRMYALYLNYFIRVENIKYICVADRSICMRASWQFAKSTVTMRASTSANS